MMAGSVDFIRLVPPDQIPAIEGSGKAYITTAPIIRVIFLNFDVAGRAGAGPTQNIKVREAISHAIDVDGIITHVLGWPRAQAGDGREPDEVRVRRHDQAGAVRPRAVQAAAGRGRYGRWHQARTS